MKINGNFKWEGIEATKTDFANVTIGGISAQWDIEFSAGELVEMIKSDAAGTATLIGFLKNDLPQVIRDCGRAVCETADEIHTVKHHNRNAHRQHEIEDARMNVEIDHILNSKE